MTPRTRSLGLAWLCLLCCCVYPAADDASPAKGKKAKNAFSHADGSASKPLSHSELVVLSTCGDEIPCEIRSKMDRLFQDTFVENRVKPRPTDLRTPELGETLRVAFWNIERGLNFEAVLAALSGGKRFSAKIDSPDYIPGSPLWLEAVEQAELLKGADVLVLNEVDWGMKRTGYRCVFRDLAARLRMNSAFSAEFLEVDPVALGTEAFAGLPEGERERLKKEIAVDRKRYRGIHGTAVLTRFRILSARSAPLPSGYDWYRQELKPVSVPGSGKRMAAQKLFVETMLREVRRGGRRVMAVELEVPGFPGDLLTVAATHIENKCKPEARRRQIEEVLIRVRDVRHPLVLAGDMNTSMSDGTPSNIQREVARRLGSASFWAKEGANYAMGVGLLVDLLTGGVNLLKNLNDPTARHVPVLAPNPESGFFETLENARFSDGYAFDFRGSPKRSAGGRGGTLANSNERRSKGFVQTYEVERSVGPVGQFKLDWIFVKPCVRGPRDESGPYRFAPHFGRTLKALNDAVSGRISDHAPITVDLPYSEPPIDLLTK